MNNQNEAQMLLNKLKEHIKQSRDIEVHEFECVCIPIPKPGENVSFPVACVTGVCFKKWGQIFRWIDAKLHMWISGKWRETNLSSTETQGEFLVVEEPKPEPVWKDCNFIEAVEWMKKHKNQLVARWEGTRYWMSPVLDKILRENDNARIYDVAGGDEVNYVLGKWQILAQ